MKNEEFNRETHEIREMKNRQIDDLVEGIMQAGERAAKSRIPVDYVEWGGQVLFDRRLGQRGRTCHVMALDQWVKADRQ